MSKRSHRRERQRHQEQLRRAQETQEGQQPATPAHPPSAGREPSERSERVPSKGSAKDLATPPAETRDSKAKTVRRARQSLRSPRGGGGSAGITGAMPWILGGGAIVVVAIIVVVIFTGGGGSSGAAIGDHWHARINITVCGQAYIEPLFESEGGIHTHGDGQAHIHPFTSDYAGDNADLAHYFRGTRMRVTQGSIQLPGDTRYRNGDPCPDGKPGALRVTINGHPRADFLSYKPQNGDTITVTFGPEGAATALPASPAATAPPAATQAPAVSPTAGP